MLRIPKARKEAILNKMLSPHPPTIVALSKQEGISEATLYNWRKQLRQEGRPVPEHDRTSENWSAQTKFAVVVETAAMTETELAQYCRSKGLYPDQIKAWRDAAIDAQDSNQITAAAHQQQSRDLESFKKRLLALEKHVAQTGEVLTESQVVALERKQEDDVAHGEIETAHPGYLGSQDTFYVGTIKGVGRIYQQTFVDTYSKWAAAKLY